MKAEEDPLRDYHPLYRMWCSIFFSTFSNDPRPLKRLEGTKKQDKMHQDPHISVISKICAEGRISNEGLKSLFSQSEAFDSVMQELTDGMLVVRDDKQKCYKLNPKFLSEVDMVLKRIEDDTDSYIKENTKTLEQSKDSKGPSTQKRCKRCKKPANMQFAKAISRLRCDRCDNDEFDQQEENPEQIKEDIDKCKVRLARLERFRNARKKIEEAIEKRRNDEVKGRIERTQLQERQIQFEAILSKIEVDRNVSEQEKSQIETLLSMRTSNVRSPPQVVKQGKNWVGRLAELNRKRASQQQGRPSSSRSR